MKYLHLKNKTQTELLDMFCDTEDENIKMDIIWYFFDMYHKKIIQTICKKFEDLDEDNLQEIGLTIFYPKFYKAIINKNKKGETIKDIGAYIYLIAENLSKDMLKLKQKNKTIHESINEDKKNNDEESVENEKLFSLIDNSLESNNVANELLPTQILLSQLILCFLNEEQSYYLYLYHYKGKTAKEIAKELNLTIGQVEGKVERGQKKISELKKLVGNVFDSELELSNKELFLAFKKLQVFDESQKEEWEAKINETSFYEQWKETLRLILLLFEKSESEQLLRFLKTEKLLHLPAQDRTEANQKLCDKNLMKIHHTIIRWQKLFGLHTEVLTT